MPEGALAEVQQEGPIAFFPNSDIWATKIAGNGVALIGDAAGAPDPTVGQGTALIFHDVRALSELLLSERNWDAATEEYAARRRRYFDVILALDRWSPSSSTPSAARKPIASGKATGWPEKPIPPWADSPRSIPTGQTILSPTRPRAATSMVWIWCN